MKKSWVLICRKVLIKKEDNRCCSSLPKEKKAYLTHCAACHNKTVNGKAVIPDISFEQADTYRVRFTNNQHKTELREETVTEQELDMIVIFFAYKKQSGVKAFEEKEEN